MKTIKLKDRWHITLAKGGFNGGDKCSYCNKRIGLEKCGLFIKRPDSANVIGIHINCIKDFAKTIVKFREDNIKDLIMEELTEHKK